LALRCKELEERQKALQHALYVKMANDIGNIQKILEDLAAQNTQMVEQQTCTLEKTNKNEGKNGRVKITRIEIRNSSGSQNRASCYASLLMYNSY
jgi:Zn-dependent oligopeptidase